MTLTEFLLARIAEDEAVARAAAHSEATNAWVVGYDSERVTDPGGVQVVPYAPEPISHHIARHDPARVLAECEAKRQIVELHRDWPVLVERPDEFEPSFGADLPFAEQTTVRVSRQIAWMTEQEYRNRFGDEPPTGPILRVLASVYADHPDYQPEWKP